MPAEKRFVLNDETVTNTHGFRILTSGIKLDRFKDNPVMLSDHWNYNENVIGRWNDVKIEGQTLTAIPEFDTEDSDTDKIAGKVERGFIKGASMGIIPNPSKLSFINNELVLTECELVEASIVPVPSNRKAIRLYNAEGELMKDEEIQTLCLSVGNEKFNQNPMKKILLSVAALMALGYKDAPKDGIEESELENKILDLSRKNEALELSNKTLKEENERIVKDQEEAAKKVSEEAVNLAISQGKFAADKKDDMVKLHMLNPQAFNTLVESIPAKQDFSAGVNTPSGTSAPTDVKTMDDFVKLSMAEQLAFKTSNPEAYKKIVEL